MRNGQDELNDGKLAEVAAHPQVMIFELKMSRGAKPGKGGILPGAKVTKEISRIRGIPAGEDSISPNGHPEISNVPQLLDMIERVRRATGKPVSGSRRWSVPMAGWKPCAVRFNRAASSTHRISSPSIPATAAPGPLMDNVGLTLKEALPMVVDILVRYGLRDCIKVIFSGKLVTPADIAWAYCACADVVVSARGFMFALGCIQALKCNNSTCPTGITTHDRRLQRGLNPANKAVCVKNYVERIRYDVDVIAHSCGVAHPRAAQAHSLPYRAGYRQIGAARRAIPTGNRRAGGTIDRAGVRMIR